MQKYPLISSVLSLFIALVCLILAKLNPQITIIPYFAVVFALLPYYLSIGKALRKKQLDLSLPPIITIYLLLYLGKGTIALIFILIILLGHLFKTFILERVKASITDISDKLPKTAVVKLMDKDAEVLIKNIKVGDILVVKSGERVTTDATLLTDEALLDESVVTGESKPIQKKKGDKLLAGSINTGNYFEAKAISTAQNSTLFQIQNLVNQAQNEKAPLAHVVSQYAWITTAFAFFGILVIFFLTHDIVKALSFWIAVVPVIFAIIVPVATTIGITILAKSGILVKSSPSLENLTKANTFLFDKTGTITQGAPEVEDVLVLHGNKNEILTIAASIEKFSNHPLSLPILAKATEQKLSLISLKSVKTLPGKGMTAIYNKKEIFVGNISLLQDQDVKISQDIITQVGTWERKGATPVFVGEQSSLLGIIFLVDKLRPEASPLFFSLSKQGYETVIVTGDKKEVAETTTRQLNHVSFIAGVKPEGKVAEVDKKVKEGRNVVMVGDGINDAPALAKANVGIAMGGRGIDLTLNAADIVLLNNNISSLPQMIRIAKQTFRIIKQDVVIATIIHLITAILVVVGSINLIQTTIIHEASSVLVLLNTLRLFQVKSK
ncbi:MAG TPA: cation-translocating P-type ATPase [Patescibacteria group bacterium]|nr:cation-translocating P-type ATPase [Patescibacteria group bacterium]